MSEVCIGQGRCAAFYSCSRTTEVAYVMRNSKDTWSLHAINRTSQSEVQVRGRLAIVRAFEIVSNCYKLNTSTIFINIYLLTDLQRVAPWPCDVCDFVGIVICVVPPN